MFYSIFYVYKDMDVLKRVNDLNTTADISQSGLNLGNQLPFPRSHLPPPLNHYKNIFGYFQIKTRTVCKVKYYMKYSWRDIQF